MTLQSQRKWRARVLIAIAITLPIASGPAIAQDESVEINLDALEALKKRKQGAIPAPQKTVDSSSPRRASATASAATRLQLLFRGVTNEISNADQLALDAFAEDIAQQPRLVEITSYAGLPGDDAQNARSIAFRRGLTVRGLLISYGLPESYIRLTVPGLAQTGENPHRIDLFVATE